jgi:hypothetical protein
MPGDASGCEEACCTHATSCGETPVSGVLLRSALVADWPDAILDGLDAAGARMEPLRDDTLGPQTRLLLFAAPVAALKIHLHPQGLHFARPETPVAFNNAEWKGQTLGGIADALLGDTDRTDRRRHSPSAVARALLAGTPHRTFRATPSPARGGTT